jgi:serine/threonine-protein kinase
VKALSPRRFKLFERITINTGQIGTTLGVNLNSLTSIQTYVSPDQGGRRVRMSIESFDVGALIGGKYRLVERVGEGGMGQVWKAEDIRHDYRPVAIKFIAWRRRGDGGEKRERFRQEMRALARLDHPNIVQLIEFDEMPDGTPYLVMNYVPGGSLERRLAYGKWGAATRRQMLEELCDALDYVHDQNIVHRDLKPSNILFDASGHVRITDFGLAKLVDSTYTASIRAGTPGFEAPEQRVEAFFAELDQGRAPRIDHRADIYSLGVIAWLLFTGRHPDDSDPLPAGTLSPELEQALRKAMAHNREERYNSAGEFLEAIVPYISSPFEAGLLPPRRGFPLWLLGVAGAIVLVLAVGGAFWARQEAKATSTPPPATERIAAPVAEVPPTATSVMLTEYPTYAPYPTYTPVPTDTPVPATSTSTPLPPTVTATPSSSPTSTPSPSPLPMATSTETPRPTPTPTCPPVSSPFTAVWQSLQGTVGCASGQVIVGLVAEENFIGGKMLWREPIDAAQILTLFNDGTWQVVEHSPYVEGSPEFSCPDADTPSKCPPTPKRGFGMVWCDTPEIRSRLGNATDCERGYQGVMQQFERGFMLQTDTGVVYVLYNDRRWERR